MASTLTVDNIVGATTAANVKLPAGSILQVVEGSATALNVTNSTSLTASNLSATITPKYSSSKVLITVSLNGCYRASETDYIVFHIYKGGSNHHSISTAVAQNGESASDSVAHSYLDSPNTTSATTYAVYMRSGTGGGNIGIGNYAIGGDGSTRSTMILTEISA